MLRPQDSATREGNFSAIESSGFRSLDEGQRVEFDTTEGPKGLQATQVRSL